MDVFPLRSGISSAFIPPKTIGALLQSERDASSEVLTRAKYLQWRVLTDASYLVALSVMQDVLGSWTGEAMLAPLAKDTCFFKDPAETGPSKLVMPEHIDCMGLLECDAAIVATLPNALLRAAQVHASMFDQAESDATLVLPDTSGPLAAWLYLPAEPRDDAQIAIATQWGTYVLVFADQIEATLLHECVALPQRPLHTLSRERDPTACERGRLEKARLISQSTSSLAEDIEARFLKSGIGPQYSHQIAGKMFEFVSHALPSSGVAVPSQKALAQSTEVLNAMTGPAVNLTVSPFESDRSDAFCARAAKWAYVQYRLRTSAFGGLPDLPRKRPGRMLFNLNTALSLASKIARE